MNLIPKRFQITDLQIIVMVKEKSKIKKFIIKINPFGARIRLIMKQPIIKINIITQQKYIINKPII